MPILQVMPTWTILPLVLRSSAGLAMKARAVALDLQRAIDESGLKISELVESRSFRKLSALFGSYYKNQLP